jgi:hypothetical protein
MMISFPDEARSSHAGGVLFRRWTVIRRSRGDIDPA